MVIKVETYYELSVVDGEPIPQDIKRRLYNKVWSEAPSKIVVSSDFWKGDLVSARKLNDEEIHEKIRTAK